MFLHICDLSVLVNDNLILDSINLSIKLGSVHAIMGPNGSGKSTLAYTLMGHPQYTITNGTIMLDNNDITKLSPDKRAKHGLFLAFQQPPAIPGVRVITFLKETYTVATGKNVSVPEFHAILNERMRQLAIDPSFAYRDLNDGFSGGERKKFELLQLLVLQSKVVILDEIDSGLDIDALKIVGNGIAIARKENPDLSIIIITHYQRILNYIRPDYVHILYDGRVVKSGSFSLVQQLEKKGYDIFRKRTEQSIT